MNSKLDLRAVEARHKETMNGFSSNPGVYVNSAADVPALLAHCRALRAALKKAEYWIGWHPETQERIDECDAARDQIAAVLAQATDQEET